MNAISSTRNHDPPEIALPLVGQIDRPGQAHEMLDAVTPVAVAQRAVEDTGERLVAVLDRRDVGGVADLKYA